MKRWSNSTSGNNGSPPTRARTGPGSPLTRRTCPHAIGHNTSGPPERLMRWARGDGTGCGQLGEPATRAPRPPGTGVPRLSGPVVPQQTLPAPPPGLMAPVVLPTRPGWYASNTSDTSWRIIGTNCPTHPIRPPSCPRTTRTSVAGITSTEGDNHDHHTHPRTPA